MIKIINSSSKKNIFMKKEENREKNINRNKLPVIKNKNKNNDFIPPKINNNIFPNYSKTCEDVEHNEKDKINNIEKKINDIKKEEKMMKEEMNKEKDQIMVLEQYKKDIQKQIDDINKEIEKENENIIKEVNDNNNKNESNLNNTEEEKFNWAYNPLMSIDQMKYLERKQKIEEDCNNKEKRYIFLKPKISNDNNNSKSYNNLYKRPFRLNNIKISNHSMDNMKKIYLKNKSQEVEKEKNIFNRNNNNINLHNNFSFQNKINPESNNFNKNIRTIAYEEKMQLKILQRSIAQEKAFNHLRKILSPEKEFLKESNYQGFNSNSNEDIYERKKKEYEIVDKARKIQVEKMKKALDENIFEKKERKKAEKEFDKKYREINEREYENYLEREKQNKLLKNEKIQNYRKMLEEQIEQKKKLMIDNKDEMEQPISLNIFSADNIR